MRHEATHPTIHPNHHLLWTCKWRLCLMNTGWFNTNVAYSCSRVPGLAWWSNSLQYSAYQLGFIPLTCACRQDSQPPRSMTVTDGGDHVSYLLDGFQSGDCGERCGGHFPDVHIHVAAVLADSHRGVFFRNVFGLFDIFRGLFNLRLAVHSRVGHCIQVVLIRHCLWMESWLGLVVLKWPHRGRSTSTKSQHAAVRRSLPGRLTCSLSSRFSLLSAGAVRTLVSVLRRVCCHPQTATSLRGRGRCAEPVTWASGQGGGGGEGSGTAASGTRYSH